MRTLFGGLEGLVGVENFIDELVEVSVERIVHRLKIFDGG